MSSIRDLLRDAAMGIYFLVIGLITVIVCYLNDQPFLMLTGAVIVVGGIVTIIMGVVLGEADRK